MKSSRQRSTPTKRVTTTSRRSKATSTRQSKTLTSLSSPTSMASTVSHSTGQIPTSSRMTTSSATSKRKFTSSAQTRRNISSGFSAGHNITVMNLTKVAAFSTATAAAAVHRPQQQQQQLVTNKRSMSTIVKAINCAEAPAAVGPYSHATTVNGMIYVSGQLPLDPKTMKFNSDTDVSLQTDQCLKNLELILKTAGSDLKHVAKTTILLNDIADFPKVNKVYAEYFTEHLPARVCYAVDKLPLGALVEIEAIAAVKEGVKNDV